MWYPPRLSILLACCRRLCAAGNVSYARPVPRAVGRFASLPCLLDVCRRMPRRFAPSSHRSRAWLCAAPASCLGSCLFPLRPSSISVPLPSHGFSPPAPPYRHAGRGDMMALWRLSICLLAHRLAISSVRFGIGWRRGSVIASLDYPLPVPAPWPSSVPLATRSLAQSDFLAVLPPHHLIAFPPRSLDTGDGAEANGLGCLPVRLGRR